MSNGLCFECNIQKCPQCNNVKFLWSDGLCIECEKENIMKGFKQEDMIVIWMSRKLYGDWNIKKKMKKCTQCNNVKFLLSSGLCFECNIQKCQQCNNVDFLMSSRLCVSCDIKVT